MNIGQVGLAQMLPRTPLNKPGTLYSSHIGGFIMSRIVDFVSLTDGEGFVWSVDMLSE